MTPPEVKKGAHRRYGKGSPDILATPRVVQATCKIDLPEGFQTSEFLLKHGFVDRIVHRSEMRSELARLIDYGAH